MTNRSRYSTAPTYGMQKRSAQKKQTPPAGPAFPPAGPAQQGPYAQPMMPGYAKPNGMPPQAAAFAPPQPAYAAQPAGFAPQPGYAPRQPGFQPPVRQAAAPMQQPVPYYPQQPYPQQPVPQEYAVRSKSGQGDSWLQILLLAVLPILFVLTLLVSASFLKYAFIGLGALALVAMWMQRAFVPSARATLTLVYGALILVSIVSLITGTTPRDTTTSTRNNGVNGSSALNQQSNTAPTNNPEGMVQMGGSNTPVVPETTPAPAPESGEDSPAWQRLQQFMNYWIANNTANMLTMVAPSWKSVQEKPDNALFLIQSNRIPQDYQFEKISATEADSSRTITMTATIDKRNSRPPVKIRFQVLMLKENNDWFVDPESLKSNDIVEDTTASTDTNSDDGSTVNATATPEVTATPAPRTKLYYNADGGTFYHADPQCKKVNAKFLPMTSFYYKDLNTTKFKNLLPCPDCHAPDRP
jgi:hypothetical protein